jgi:hypothetical protein
MAAGTAGAEARAEGCESLHPVQTSATERAIANGIASRTRVVIPGLPVVA